MTLNRLILIALCVFICGLAAFVAFTEYGWSGDLDDLEHVDGQEVEKEETLRGPNRASAKGIEGERGSAEEGKSKVDDFVRVFVQTKKKKPVIGREVCIMKTKDVTPAGYWSPLRAFTDSSGFATFKRSDFRWRFKDELKLTAIVLGPRAAKERIDLERDEFGRLQDATITISDGMSLVIEFQEENRKICPDDIHVQAQFAEEGKNFDSRVGLSVSGLAKGTFPIQNIPDWYRLKLSFNRMSGQEIAAGQIVEFLREDLDKDNKLVVTILPIFAMELTIDGPKNLQEGTSFSWHIQNRLRGFDHAKGKGKTGIKGVTRIVPEDSDARLGLSGTMLSIILDNDEGRWIGTVSMETIARRTQNLGVCVLSRFEPLMTGTVVDRRRRPVQGALVTVELKTANGVLWRKANTNAKGRFEVFPRRIGDGMFSDVQYLMIQDSRFETMATNSNFRKDGVYTLTQKPSIVLPLINGANAHPDILDNHLISCVYQSAAIEEDDEKNLDWELHVEGSQAEIRWNFVKPGRYRINIENQMTEEVERDVIVEVRPGKERTLLKPLTLEVANKCEVVVRRSSSIRRVRFVQMNRFGVSRFLHVATKEVPLFVSRSADSNCWYSIDEGASWFPFKVVFPGPSKLVIEGKSEKPKTHTFQVSHFKYDSQRFRVSLRARRMLDDSVGGRAGNFVDVLLKADGSMELLMQPESKFFVTSIEILEYQSQKKTRIRASQIEGGLGVIDAATSKFRFSPKALQAILAAFSDPPK